MKIILFFFFLTGLTGLMYELIWTRMLILAFGSTHFAITTVLTIYMAGLALGSFIFGKLIDNYKSNPLKMYAIIELFVGAYCLMTPFIFTKIKSIYLAISSHSYIFTTFNPYQFALSFLGIIIPTTLMGGTLPVMIKFFTLKGSVSKSNEAAIGHYSGVLYAINTFGAVTGTLLTGLFFLFFLGIKASLYAAGGIDILLGVIILLKFSSDISNKSQNVDNNTASPVSTQNRATGRIKYGINTLILLSFSLSGFTALAYEVLWSRVLSLILGSSIYAFTIILTAFLSGISLGSIFFTRIMNKWKSPILLFAVLEAVIGFSAIISIFLYPHLPFLFGWINKYFSQNFWGFLFLQFFICLSIMIIPTLSMGALFPIVTKIYAKDLRKIGTSIGKVYSFNTLGSIAGSFIAGFIMIPLIGVQTSICILAGINILIFSLLMCATDIQKHQKIIGIATPLLVAFSLFHSLPEWNRNLMTVGPYVTPILDKGTISKTSQNLLDSKLVYYKEGLNAVITVRQKGDEISYQANGKQEAKIFGDKPSEAWYLLGHIPMMLSKNPKNALLVGLGSGITLGAMEEYPLNKIDVVELEPAVVEASTFFSKANKNASKDPRVSMHITDGRGFLSSTETDYDVIISGVSDPWISGVSNLFTKEYFQDMYKKIRPDGVAVIWFQNYKLSDSDFKTGINTFASTFPYVSLWFHYKQTADLIVIGSKEEILFDTVVMNKKFSIEKVRKGLKQIGINEPFDFFEFFLIGNKDLKRYLAGAAINTDNMPILEFSLPKAQYTHQLGSAERIDRLLSEVKEIIPPVLQPSGKKELERFYQKLGETFYKGSFRNNQTTRIFKKVLELNPENTTALKYLKALR